MPPERVLFLLSRVLGGKTFSGHLMRVVETMGNIRPHFVFLEESDYGSLRRHVPAWKRASGLYVGASILRHKLRADPPPPCDAVFVQSFEILPALSEIDPSRPAILAHDSTNVLSYRLIRDTAPGPVASLVCGLKSKLVTPAYRSGVKRTRVFLPRTHWCARSLVQDFGVDPGRILVAPGGLDLEKWSPGPPREPGGLPVLLFVGNDFARKGGAFLLDIYQRHFAGRARLRIVSNDPALAGRSWPEGVEHLSGLGHGDVGALLEAYRGADLFVFPTRKEHMGMVLTEACAVGLPIVATDVGGVREAVRDGGNGVLVPYRADEEAWVAAILGLLQDPQRRARMGAASRALATHEFAFGVLRNRVETAFAMLA
jgi:glycosyltransferase involved in cell wall biosynthesis